MRKLTDGQDSRKLLQWWQEISFEEAKTTMKERQKRRWLQQYPHDNRQDVYYFLPRENQVIIVRLRNDHCWLRHHMFIMFHNGYSAVSPWGTSPMTVEHLLQNRLSYHNLRAETLPASTPVREKLYKLLSNLLCMAAAIRVTGIAVWANKKEEMSVPEVGLWQPVQWLNCHICKTPTNMAIPTVLAGEWRRKRRSLSFSTISMAMIGLGGGGGGEGKGWGREGGGGLKQSW